jgi:tetratricopeptide (TPR) repeat protein
MVMLDDPPDGQIASIREALTEGQLAMAEVQLELLLKHNPAHAEGLLFKGILSVQREQYESAEAAFEAALRQGAERRKCLMGIGMAAIGRAYPQGAWERFREVLAEHPDDAEAIHWLLRAGTAQNRWQELGEHLHRYTIRNPGDLAVRFALTGVLLRGEEIEAARREYDALCQVDSRYDGLVQLGQAIVRREVACAMETTSA